LKKYGKIVREEKVGGKKSTGIFIKVRKKYEKYGKKNIKKVREKNEKSTEIKRYEKKFVL
jgi:hypothetical protein